MVNSCLIRDMSVAQKNVNVYTTKSCLKISKMDYSVFCPTPTPRHFLLFKIENTEQDLKFPLMTQGYHYGKQFQNDVISQGLWRWVELPVPTEWSRTIALFEIFKLVTYHLPCYCLMLFTYASVPASSGNPHAALSLTSGDCGCTPNESQWLSFSYSVGFKHFCPFLPLLSAVTFIHVSVLLCV